MIPTCKCGVGAEETDAGTQDGGGDAGPPPPCPDASASDCATCALVDGRREFTERPAGTACALQSVCAGGSCQVGCFIAGVFYHSGDAESAGKCSACEPAVRSDVWTPVTGIPCPGGICFQGSCQAGCAIDGQAFAAGQRNPANPGACCLPALSMVSWSATFQPGGTYRVGLQGELWGGSHTLAAADFNGDGFVDLAVANGFDNTLSILINNRDGTFSPAVNYPAEEEPYALVAGRIDGDIWPDVAVYSVGSNRVGVFINRGDGTFSDEVAVNQPNPAPAGLRAGDFDGDGRIELILSDDHTSTILKDWADGGFTTAQPFANGLAAVEFSVFDHFHDPSILDVGYVDPFDSSLFKILLGNGDGTFQPPVTYVVSPAQVGYWVLGSGDMDGNGTIDFVSGLEVFSGNGDGTFATQPRYGSPSPINASIVIEDLDGDGKAEEVGTDWDRNVVIVWDGLTGTQTKIPVSLEPLSVLVLDLRGSGVHDIAVLSGLDNVVNTLINVCP